MRSGARVQQLAISCPGLLLLARALDHTRRHEDAAWILEGAVDGMRLNNLIDRATTIAATIWPERGWEDPRARTFVRRAPSRLEASAFTAGFGQGIALSDIPAEPQARVIWYDVVGQLVVQDGWSALSPESQVRLSGFVSRSALELAADSTLRGCPVETILIELLHYARYGCVVVPSRRCSADRVLGDVSQWGLGTALDAAQDLPDETALWPCRAETPKPPLRATQLTTVKELREEGAKMRHCVAIHAGEAASGEIYVFRAEYDAERLTVAARPSGAALQLVEVAGAGNRPPSNAARRAISEWLAGVQPGA